MNQGAENADAKHPVILFWEKIPGVIRGFIAGYVVLQIGVTIPGFLALENIKNNPELPWFLPLAIVFIWLYAKYLNGWAWPKSTSTARNTSMRLNAIPRELRFLTLITVVSGIIFTLGMHFTVTRFMDLPVVTFADALGDAVNLTVLPWWTVAALVITISLSAAIVEEAAFRGFLQVPIEKSHGPVVAISISAILFAVAHFNHSWGIMLALPLMLAALWYGAVAYITNSILPTICVHLFLDLFFFTDLVATGALFAEPISKTGIDKAFMLASMCFVLGGLCLFTSLRKLWIKAAELEAVGI